MEVTTIKHINLTHSEWAELKERLIAEYGNRILISWVCRRELGFTVREHVDRRLNEENHTGHWKDQISSWHLDFYDESMKSWFLLKYSK